VEPGAQESPWLKPFRTATEEARPNSEAQKTTPIMSPTQAVCYLIMEITILMTGLESL